MVTFLSFLFLSPGFIAIPWLLAIGLTPEKKRKNMQEWLITWSVQGVLVPIVLWAAMNIGISFSLQPFMPEVQAAKNRGAWASEYFQALGGGVFVVSTYWCAVTLGWLAVSATLAADASARREFRSLCLTCLFALCIPSVLTFLVGGLPAVGLAATVLLAPMLGYGRDLLQPRKLPPMYSRAVARIKFGKYNEAEWEIIKELDNWEDDFDGWMMLADLYANQFKDLDEAERTVREIVDQPATTPSQLAVALHRLADWHLKLAQDPDAARRALQIICDRLKGTHLAHMAQLRMNQLPASAAELREQTNAQPIPLPALGDQMDLPAAPSGMDREKAAKLANACVEQLKQNPNNVAAREKLARTLAERLGKAPMAIEQINLLLEMPDRSEEERAGWLGLVAAWQIKYCQNVHAGQQVLERLVREFPNSVQAMAARRRLELLSRQSDPVAKESGARLCRPTGDESPSPFGRGPG
jgi:hypothetical protein